MKRILGIDPGSRSTGYGIIAQEKQQLVWIAHGQIQTQSDHQAERLYQIFQGLSSVIAEYEPQYAAVEQVFVYKNVQSALKLGQARGAALVAAAHYHLPIAEYSPKQIKQAVVGYGGANKSQIQQMIKLLLRLPEPPPSDAADALAIALCHTHFQQISTQFAKGLITAGKII